MKLRVTDDEIFAQDNSVLDRDISTMEAEFGQPIWDSQNGRLGIGVKNRYHHAPMDKTLVNVGLGGCEPEVDSGLNTALNLRAFWEQYSGSATDNPVTTGTGAFVDCDLLAKGNFPAALSNADMFATLR